MSLLGNEQTCEEILNTCVVEGRMRSLVVHPVSIYLGPTVHMHGICVFLPVRGQSPLEGDNLLS